MALLGTLQVRMGLDTASFGTTFNSFTKDLEKRSKRFGKGLSGLTNIGSLLGGAGLGAMLSEGVSIAADFEKTMNKVAAAANVGAEGMGALRDVVADATEGTIFSMNQGAEGLLALQKAGQTVLHSKSSLAEALKLAAAEGFSFEAAAELMVKTLNQFNLGAEESARVSDALAGGAAASTASLAGLKESLKAVGTNANAAGLDLHETIGMFALFADRALEGSDAGTSAKTMLSRLVPTTDKAAAAMEKYGLKFTDAKGNFIAITEVFDLLHQKMGQLSESERSAALGTIFGTDAIRAANIAVKDGGATLAKYIDLTKDRTAAEKAAEAGSKGFAGAMLRLKNNIAGLFIDQSGQTGFLKFLEEMATKANGLVDKLKGLSPEFFKVALGVGAGLAVLPAFALAISSIAAAVPSVLTVGGAIVAFLTGPWGIAIGAAVGIAILFKDQLISAWDGIKAWFADWVENNRAALQNLKAAWDGLLAALVPLWEAIKTGFKLFGDALLSAFGTDSSTLVTSFKDGLSVDLTNAVFIVTDFLEALTEIVTWFTTNVPILAEKGYALYTSIADWLGQTKDMWVEIWDGLIQDIENAWIEIKSSIRNSADAIMEMWRNFSWLELGSAIIDGIVLGIKNGASAAVEAAKAMATSVITGAKDILGIHSPSRVFHGIGQDVGDGFVNGIASKFGDAKLAVGKLVGAGSDSGFANFFLSSFTRNLTGDVGKKRFEEFTKSIKDGALQVQSAWTSSMNHIGSAIDEFVKTGKLNFSDLVRSMIADLASSALKNAFNGLLQGIMGITGGGSVMGTGSLAGGGGNWLSGLGSIFGGLFGGMASFEGGGYTGDGSRSGGLDGRGGRLAMIHPRETVIDHAAVKRAADRGRSRGDVHISTPITLMPGVSKEELAQILPMLKRDILDTIPAMISRGGRYASAFGQ